MALLGKKVDYFDEELDGAEEYQIPSVFRDNHKELSLKKSIFLSTILHPTIVGLAWLLVFILTIMGINIALFDKPEPKPKDIEFVLVDKEAMPINKKTPYRADKNSRAGGKHDPTKKVSLPQAAAPKAPAQKAAAPAQKAQPTKQVKQQQPQQQQQKQKVQPKKAAPKQTTAKPNKTEYPMEAPRPTPKPAAPRPTAKPKSEFAIPIPKSAIPKVAMPSGGPITSSQKGTSSGSSGHSSGAPSPSFSPSSSSSGAGKSTGGGRFSGSHGSSSGNIGNPGPGNPKGAPGIDALREPDFGPYMRELQRRIKMNWDPPKGDESKRVVLLFSISRDGRLLSVKVHKSSGLASADKAAIAAVQLTAPFKPLPPEYKGSSVDIQFTFDYNVFGASRY